MTDVVSKYRVKHWLIIIVNSMIIPPLYNLLVEAVLMVAKELKCVFLIKE